MNLETDVPRMKHEETGRGEPIGLLPGGLTGWRSWLPFVEVLATGRRVIRLQLRNVEFGLSGDLLPANYSLDYEVTALENTLDGLGIEQADLAGWSLGGTIALSYAIRRPQRVRSLILIEPAAYWALPNDVMNGPAIQDERDFFQSLATDELTEEQIVGFAHYAGLVPVGIDPRTHPQWPVWFEHRQSLRAGGVEYRHQDKIERVRAFEKPVLLVKGEGSNPTFHMIVDLLAGAFPNARVVTLPGGHAAHIVSMDKFLDLFTRFLTEAG